VLKMRNQKAVLRVLILFAFVFPLAGTDQWDLGLSGKGARIEVSVVVGANAALPIVLIIGGLEGDDASAALIRREVKAFEAIPQNRRPFQLMAIPLANPDGARLHFPPAGVAYREEVESNALWRWIGIHAPDLVLVAANADFGLADALSQNVVAGVARIPARRVAPVATILPNQVAKSDARREIERRRGQTPKAVAEELALIYGRDFDQMTYLPGMSLIARLRLGHTADVAKLAAQYVDGTKDPLLRANSLTLAGHLVFAELAERTPDPRFAAAVRRAADLGFTETGEMKESMPFHDEMSDSVFMAIPILAKAGKLTGDRRYFDMAARHLAFMQKLVLRPDGLYRHSPLTDAAWGRGNAFPAMGLALTLSDFPTDHPQHATVLRAFQQHMATLSKFQNEEGMWLEVIDHPGAYAEFSATAMIATSMLRGIRRGWLASDVYQPIVDKAWQAVVIRIGPDGQLMDVCESTNKQRSLDDYIHRAALLGRDPRGGGMALIFATEMAGLQ
jgi:unsaturated rhamnogalacturonyl hydrolase